MYSALQSLTCCCFLSRRSSEPWRFDSIDTHSVPEIREDMMAKSSTLRKAVFELRASIEDAAMCYDFADVGHDGSYNARVS